MSTETIAIIGAICSVIGVWLGVAKMIFVAGEQTARIDSAHSRLDEHDERLGRVEEHAMK